MSTMRTSARIGAYLITILLAAVWTVAALDSLMRPMFDLSRAQTGDLIIAFAHLIALPAGQTVALAQLLAALKLLIGTFLFVTLMSAVHDKLRFGACDDAMLDVGLFLSVVASVAAALPGFALGGSALQAVVGELMLALIASALAVFGRGYLTREELPPPQRPAFLIVRA